MAPAARIGGLLAVREERDASYPGGDGTFSFLFTHDGTGNVAQVVDLSPGTWDAEAVMVARYEYEPYGRLRSSAGAYRTVNPFRFSTKYWDAESGLGYWGRRFYRPDTGRWMNRDPIEEAGGNNVYCYASNAPCYSIDLLGLTDPGWCSGIGTDAYVPPLGTKGVPRRNRSDCWQSRLDPKIQAALKRMGAEGAVLCRPDGCRCACLQQKKYPGGPPGGSEAISQRCALVHEETHVQQKRDGGALYCPFFEHPSFLTFRAGHEKEVLHALAGSR